MAPDDAETSRLVLRAQLGDRLAGDLLLRLASPRLHAHLAHLLGDDATAADVTQDTLVLIWKRVGQLREPRAFWAWAFRIATRQAARARRRTRGASSPSIDIEPRSSPPEQDPLEARALVDMARANVRTLSPAHKEIIALHYAEGFSLAACAAILGIPTGTAKSRLNAALARLRSGWRDGSDPAPPRHPHRSNPPHTGEPHAPGPPL